MKQRSSKNIIIIIWYIIFACFFSCQKKDHKDLIEIYILKERIKTDEGIPFNELKNNKNINNDSLKDKIDLPNYDTINNEFVYAGKFEVENKNIREKPLINNDEIIMLDTVSSKIKLSASAINKIVLLKPSMKEGIQFVICKNKTPLFSGYFWSSFSSYGSTWNCIEYNHTTKVEKPIILNIYKGRGMDFTKRVKINFNKYPELLIAFNKNNKTGNL